MLNHDDRKYFIWPAKRGLTLDAPYLVSSTLFTPWFVLSAAQCSIYYSITCHPFPRRLFLSLFFLLRTTEFSPNVVSDLVVS